MEKHEVTLEDLERLAAEMAAAIPGLECADSCKPDWKFEYIEKSAAMYQEELEWAVLHRVLVECRVIRKSST